MGEEVNIIFNLFEDVVYYKIDELDDDSIFNRKVILKLVQNHKEFLTIMFDLTRETSLDQEAEGVVYKMTKRVNEKKKKEVDMI